MKYYRDVDTGNIVRQSDNKFALEYIQKGILKWIETEADCSYEREIYLGEGNTCLFDITYEEALKILSSWGYKEEFNEPLNDKMEDERNPIFELLSNKRSKKAAQKYAMYLHDCRGITIENFEDLFENMGGGIPYDVLVNVQKEFLNLYDK